MREVLPQLLEWWEAGETVGMGTVVATFRSAPRPPGASMLVGPDASAVGSVSGGCVEGAVYELAQEVVGTGAPVLERYGVSDDDAFAVGLTCGGILDVYVERVSRETFPELGEVAADLADGTPVAIATVVEHPDAARVGRRMFLRPATPGGRGPGDGGDASGEPAEARVDGSLGSRRMDDAVRDDALGLLAAGHSGTLSYGPDGERRGEGTRVFVWAFAPRPGCWCSVRSTSRQRSPGWGASSATTSPCATPARSSRPRAGSPRPTRSSSSGRTATSPPSTRRGASIRGPSSPC